MSSITPFLLVATLVAAVGVASVTQAQPARDTTAMAQLRIAAGHASSISPGVLVLAAR